MTKILGLEMKGFKSFANKTRIPFGKAFNCVLGPNGSGKSNVIDAICFVLGKASAKGMRAEKSANLIYNGGKKKNPAKEGEVSIIFSNDKKIFGDFDELIITRIVTKSGQSKYRINGRKSSRQEILDILARDKINPDGYNIILQGDINHLIEMTPQQRRLIIEEIAGISLYEEKKVKALRELTRVDEKLNSAEIVLTERKTYLRELKKERDQAQKFKDLDEKIKRNKTTLLTVKRDKRVSELKTFHEQIEKNESRVNKLKEKELKVSGDLDERKEGIEAINKEVERRGEKEQVLLHKEVEELKVDVAVKNNRLEAIEGELVKLEQRKSDLLSTNKELLDKINNAESKRKEIERLISSKDEDVKKLDVRLKEFRKKHKMEDATKIDGEITSLDAEAEKLQEALGKLREEQQQILRDKDKAEIKLEHIDDKIAKVLGIEQEHKQELKRLKEKKESFKSTTKELNNALTEDSSLAAQLQTARTKLLSNQEALSKLQGKQASIMERVAGGRAISAILEQKEIKGIHGTVSALGRAKEEYALALEMAAGGRINSIVVETDAVAAKCIRYLRERKLGVATFLPINKLRTVDKPKIKKGAGIVGLASDLIEYDPKYEKVFRYVLGNTIIVQNLDIARKLGVGSARMVTLNGDLLETSGAMRGGFHTERKSAGFQQQETAEEIEKLEAEIMDLETLVARLESKRSENEEVITNLREIKAGLEGDIIKGEKSLHLDSEDIGLTKGEKKLLEAESKKLESQLEKITDEITDKTSELGKLKMRKQTLRDKITTLRSPTLIAEMNSFEEKSSELRDSIRDLKVELRTAESEVKNILGPESEKIKSILKQHDKEKKGFDEERRGIKEKVGSLEKKLKEKEKQEEKFFKQFKDLFTKRTKLNEAIRIFENTLRTLQEEQRGFDQKKIALSLESARLKAELSGVEEELRQFEGVKPYKSDEKSEEKILLEVREFERMVEKMGAVNMKALNMYEQVLTEYESLVEKKKTLSVEREDVLIMINEIDSKKKELFMKTFDVVGENFKHFFGRLTTKGDAYLDLEDEQDPFNGGMTIKVKLTGKKFLDIRSLSGGEKTMTALAFLFAVQEHAPASFYIMDEVDAALDKHNSNRLAKLIRQYCTNAQYIIISHNEGIITEADNLYGVSMNEYGISKITSLRI